MRGRDKQSILFYRKNFNPIIIRVINKVKPHGCVFVTYTSKLFMVFTDFILIAFHSTHKWLSFSPSSYGSSCLLTR